MGLKVYKPSTVLPSVDLGDIFGSTPGTDDAVFVDAAGKPIVCPLPSAGALDRKMFRVVAWGRAASGAAKTFTVSLDYGISATVTSDTVLVSATAAALASSSHNWQMDADLVWDSTSGAIQGCATFRIAAAAITARVVITPVAADPASNLAQGLVISAQFDGTDAGNHAYLDGFQIEEIN